MDGEGQAPKDLSVRLSSPGDDQDQDDIERGNPADTSASLTARIDTLTDAMITLRSFVNERMGDVGDAVARSQTQISHELNQAFSRLRAQTTQQLDDALLEVRNEITRDLEEAATEAGDQMAQQVGAAAVREAGTERAERLGADIAAMSESVAGALTQVADQLDAAGHEQPGAAGRR